MYSEQQQERRKKKGEFKKNKYEMLIAIAVYVLKKEGDNQT